MSDPTKSPFPQLLPLSGTQEELCDLLAAAAADDHAVFAPTHVIRKHGELSGYASIGGCVPVITWLGPQLKARDTLFLNQLTENLVKAQSGKPLLVPCEVDSPLNDSMASLGYQTTGKPFKLWTK